MKVKLLFFGSLSEVSGKEEMNFISPGNSESLVMDLYEKFPGLRQKDFKISVNQKLVRGSADLTDGDEIALLPPFSGG